MESQDIHSLLDIIFFRKISIFTKELKSVNLANILY